MGHRSEIDKNYLHFRDANWEWVDSDKRPLEFSYVLVPKSFVKSTMFDELIILIRIKNHLRQYSNLF